MPVSSLECFDIYMFMLGGSGWILSGLDMSGLYTSALTNNRKCSEAANESLSAVTSHSAKKETTMSLKV